MIKHPLAFLFLMGLACGVARGQSWRPLGPPGGDVRSLAADPSHPGRLFLGAADGHIFGSEDSGENWKLLGRAGSRWDSVITAILVDPRDTNILFVSAWTQEWAAGGGVFRSHDGGHSWSPAGLEGKAVRALAMAPSDPDVLVAGTLDGVYRSRDGAQTWERISPEHHAELHNFDSIAVDPLDPQTIYAGTFHLPWKTTDGGRTWFPVHDGMIDDSDVMSLLPDRAIPGRIYASACSGIYRSGDGAAKWEKIQGIPYAARRTYEIAQDPRHAGTVYAATSQGLWRTSDAGATWHLETPPDWVVNAVVVPGDPPGRVVMGTEQMGALASDDGGEHFHDANQGFFHRRILALALDSAHPGRVLAVLAHAPEPVLATEDGGRSWSSLGHGLRAEAILRAYASPEGWWVSLARGGLMRYDAQKKSWLPAGMVIQNNTAGVPMQDSRARRRPSAFRRFDRVVNDMTFSATHWFAATPTGLLGSADHGVTWIPMTRAPLAPLPVESVRASPDGQRIWAVSLGGLLFSSDGGKSWSWRDLPLEAGGAKSVDLDPEDADTLAAVARNGLFISRDGGRNWRQAGDGLPSTPVRDFAISGGLFLAAMRTGGLYVSSDSGRSWSRVPGPVADGSFSAVTTAGDPSRIFAASSTDGLYWVEWHFLVASTASHKAVPQ